MSKALEALKEFKGNNNTILVGRVMGKQHYLDCLQAIEKSLKALEIIKEKNVDIDYFLFWSKQGVLGKVEDYNQLLKHKNGRCKRLPLTEEEFNLLKEVLEWAD